ncbi:hypothetical protein HN018_22780 (plasmid) [Lichenicola cladoniae]|uniref:Uncharacterized protein n=1 Tax=Lichenicola cladoniae TaxID=1484109 RepID=A0A6M8HWS9_9PROT|nr:hypothetical protein [Lichenicola cladoniae]NPD69328.1 hypothetical protein [Acetobacteraceae bacterium]QKE93029.1 hypothetical protein HN018_22780 [Lichenicola cladoniae]
MNGCIMLLARNTCRRWSHWAMEDHPPRPSGRDLSGQMHHESLLLGFTRDRWAQSSGPIRHSASRIGQRAGNRPSDRHNGCKEDGKPDPGLGSSDAGDGGCGGVMALPVDRVRHLLPVPSWPDGHPPVVNEQPQQARGLYYHEDCHHQDIGREDQQFHCRSQSGRAPASGS